MKNRDGKRRTRKSEKKGRRQKTQVRKKVARSRKQGVCPMIRGSAGSKSRLAQAAGAEPSGQMRDEKLHAVAARSTHPSQKVQSTPTPDHI